MLMQACDVRLPVRLSQNELDVIAEILLTAVDTSMGREAA